MSADLLTTFKARYAFPLDDFQLRAALAAFDQFAFDRVSADLDLGTAYRAVCHVSLLPKVESLP